MTAAAAINILLVLIAVVNRRSVSSGILAAALSMAAGMTFDLMLFVVEWTSKYKSLLFRSRLTSDVEMCITSVERIEEYIKLPPQETRPSSGDEWLHHGSIRFTKVSARYKPTLPPAISNISLTVKPGQRVGICGRSGSGKSTLLGVLWRLIDIDEDGEIMVDGIDIRDVPLGDYRNAMSIVPQGMSCQSIFSDARPSAPRVDVEGESRFGRIAHGCGDLGCCGKESCECHLPWEWF